MPRVDHFHFCPVTLIPTNNDNDDHGGRFGGEQHACGSVERDRHPGEARRTVNTHACAGLICPDTLRRYHKVGEFDRMTKGLLHHFKMQVRPGDKSALTSDLCVWTLAELDMDML